MLNKKEAEELFKEKFPKIEIIALHFYLTYVEAYCKNDGVPHIYWMYYEDLRVKEMA